MEPALAGLELAQLEDQRPHALKHASTEAQLSRLERYERQATVRWELTVAELEAAHLDLMIEE